MTVIREGVIRLRVERSGSVGGGHESRAFATEARAAREAAREVGRHSEAINNSAESVRRFERQSLRSYNQVGRGLLEFGRGVAFMAASTDEDLQRMLKSLVAIEATVHTLKGGADTLKGLAAIIGTGATVATSFAAAITGAFLAVDYFSDSSRRARRELEQFNAVKEQSLKLSRLEADSLREQSLLRNEQRGIDRDVALLGGPAQQIAGLSQLGLELAREREGGARRETFSRNRLGAIDAGEAPEKARGETMQQLLDAEMRQQEALRREIQNNRDLEAARLRQIDDQQASIRSNNVFSAFGSFGKAAEDTAIAGLERQKQQITDKTAAILSDLLGALRAQAEQVNQVRRDLQSLER